MNSIVNWPFLNEPLWRWVVFLIALGLIMGIWSRVLALMV